MSKLSIAFLSVFYPFRGGIAQFNNELFTSLKEDSAVSAYNFTKQYPAILFPGKTQLVDKQDPDPSINATAVLNSVNPLSYLATSKLINKQNPDVMITSYWMPFFAPALGKSISGVKAKKVALLHNVIPHEKRFFDDAFNKYYLSKNNAFIVLSDTVKNQLLSYIPDAKYIQIPHPVYSHFGKILDKSDSKISLGINPERKVVLFFGFIRKYKGLDLLIEALSTYDDNFTLLIAGESYENEGELTEQLAAAGIEGEKLCKCVKYIPDDEVKLYFSASDVCVLPYRTATQSGIAAIAKHFEVPMVVTPVGELPNEVNHDHDGIVCDDVSPQSIKQGIIKAVANQVAFQEYTRKDNKENTFGNFGKKVLEFINTL